MLGKKPLALSGNGQMGRDRARGRKLLWKVQGCKDKDKDKQKDKHKNKGKDKNNRDGGILEITFTKLLLPSRRSGGKQ